MPEHLFAETSDRRSEATPVIEAFARVFISRNCCDGWNFDFARLVNERPPEIHVIENHVWRALKSFIGDHIAYRQAVGTRGRSDGAGQHEIFTENARLTGAASTSKW